MVALEEVAEGAVGAEVPRQELAGAATASRTIAPAPSPTSTDTLRSSQSVIRLSVWDPITSSRSAPMARSPWATVSV